MGKVEYNALCQSIDSEFLLSLPVWKRIQFTMFAQVVGLAIDYRHRIRIDPLNETAYKEQFAETISKYEYTFKNLAILGGPGIYNKEEFANTKKITFATPLEFSEKDRPDITPTLTEEQLKDAIALYKSYEDTYKQSQATATASS